MRGSVHLRGVRKFFGGRLVLDIEELTVSEGEFFVLVGPSGSGKTTLLRVLAGLVRPDGGEVRLKGEDAAGRPPHQRSIGFVFQGLALWPHLTVRGNLALGLSRIVASARERTERIQEVARELDIERFLGDRPARLSGGEQQRVALARALVRRPDLLLLDEPFSDLDARLRRSIARLVRRLHDAHGMTTILITHDRTDAHLLADRIGVLRQGRLVAMAAPDVLHAEPESAFAAEFMTDAAILRGRAAGDGSIETDLGRLHLAEPGGEGEVVVAVRPEEIELGRGPVTGRVVACEFAGGPWRCRVAVGETEVAAHSEHPLRAGDEVALTPPATPRTILKEDA
ncbi:MAG: ABC transporter ATP-binding protein [Planctomycetota bacterium]|jgi:ABC-type Fe3+/spermidine/putrescine transport system ATPase subunit